MIDYQDLIEKEVSSYEGRHADLILQAPALFHLLTGLLADPRLSGKLRPLVLAAIAYFVLPADIIPEDLRGPHGYADDIFLAALVADHVRRQLDADEVLMDHWEAETPIFRLLVEILELENELIGDKRELILWYIGFEHLMDHGRD